MGYFLAVTAIKTDSVEDIIATTIDYMTTYDLSTEIVNDLDNLDYKRDAQIYKTVAGWTVILWPEFFNVHDFPFARSIAASKGCLSSTVHVYDSEYWEHLACSGDTELHIFCSWPSYWKEAAPDEYREILGYEDDPSRLAAVLNLDPATIQPYFVAIDRLDDPETKADHEDEFALSNFWVFTDFWRKMGIVYPTPSEGLIALLRLGHDFRDKLPTA